MRAKMCVIVDGYSSGNLYASRLKARGFDVVHVQSAPEIAADFQASFQAGDFIESVIHHDRLWQTRDT